MVFDPERPVIDKLLTKDQKLEKERGPPKKNRDGGGEEWSGVGGKEKNRSEALVQCVCVKVPIIK